MGSSALVGYAAVDGEADFRNTMAEYMTCGEDAVSVDLYGEFVLSTLVSVFWYGVLAFGG